MSCYYDENILNCFSLMTMLKQRTTFFIQSVYSLFYQVKKQAFLPCLLFCFFRQSLLEYPAPVFKDSRANKLEPDVLNIILPFHQSVFFFLSNKLLIMLDTQKFLRVFFLLVYFSCSWIPRLGKVTASLGFQFCSDRFRVSS